MTKEEKIQEAYGENYDKCKPDENGMCLINESDYPKIEWVYEGFGYNKPKSLQGIENNNGWINIESEDDLPTEHRGYFTKTNYCKEIVERDYPIFTKSMSIEDERKWWLENITHYQPIQKPQPPIY